MKKLLVSIVMATALAGASGVASADDNRRGHGGGHHGGYQSQGYGRHHNRRNYRPRHSYRTRHHYRPVYRSGYRYGYHSGRHELRKGLKIAAGAILLGSVIHAATDHHRERVVVRKRVTPARQNSDYYYRYDEEGQCVEVSHNSRGEEVWTYMDQSYCE